MFCIRRRTTHRRIALSVGAVLVLAVSANADPLNFLAANAQPTPIFDASAGLSGEWTIPGATFFDGSAIAGPDIFFIDPSGFTAGGTIAWTGNGLDQDLSAGGTAEATFFGGGAFSMSGTVLNAGFTPIFTGVLLTGNISSFSVREPAGFDDALDLVVDPILTPTGGALADGTISTMTVPYFLSFTVAGANQNGGPLVDFQSDINSILSMQFELTAVPEPGSLMLLLGGVALITCRRR
jgi:hypothetical protein